MNKMTESWKSKDLIGLENQNLQWAMGQPGTCLVTSQNYPKAQDLATPSLSGNRGEECWGSRIRRIGRKSFCPQISNFFISSAQILEVNSSWREHMLII